MNDFLKNVLLGNRVIDYLSSFVVITAAVGAARIFRKVLLSRLKGWAQKTEAAFNNFIIELIEKVGIPLLYFGSLYLGLAMLMIDPEIRKVVHYAAVIVFIYAAGATVNILMSYAAANYMAKRENNIALEHSLEGVTKVGRVIVWVAAVIFLLDNLGFKVSGIVAGLGVGGIAVGLAAQAVLKDLFSYFSILFDRPFETGDVISVGEYSGTVEYIGAKTTRLRSDNGEQLVFSNSQLTDSCVRNFKRMKARRIVFKIGVAYETKLDKLKQIPRVIKEIIEGIPDVQFDYANFLSYGDFGLVYEICYFVAGNDYNKYLEAQQRINLGIKENFDLSGIAFAYSKQFLYVNKQGQEI